MNPAAILDLIEKGLTLLPLLISAGVDIGERVQQLITLANAAKNGTPISDEELARIRAQLDSDLDDFNKPMD